MAKAPDLWRGVSSPKMEAKRVAASIAAQSKAKTKMVTYEVGFSAHYALIVHENVDAYHANGQAKYLEAALRRHGAAARKMVAEELKRGRGLGVALKKGADFILREAQKLVPVRTGFLQRSGFVKEQGV